MKRALFVDRDGTLIVEKHYLSDPDQVELEAGVVEGLVLAMSHGYEVVIVTNQAGIGRGFYSVGAYQAVADRVVKLLADAGVSVLATYYCPHHPTDGIGSFLCECECRKPNPGMLIRASQDWGLSLADSVMIGDKESDIVAGKRAGVRQTVLVRSGYGHTVLDTVADRCVDTFLDAVRDLPT
jgi:D-glycero-D-manno-heptose 1,7-bisphosphate phosphatase